MKERLLTNGDCRYLTTENPEKFTGLASLFLDETVDVSHIDL